MAHHCDYYNVMHKICYYNGNMYAEENLFKRLQKLSQHTNATLFDIMYELCQMETWSAHVYYSECLQRSSNIQIRLTCTAVSSFTDTCCGKIETKCTLLKYIGYILQLKQQKSKR